MSCLLAACCATLPALAQNVPSASMLGPSSGKVPSTMALKWVVKVNVESVDQGAIDQVNALFSRNGFSAELSHTERADQPVLWQIAGTREYAVRSTQPDLMVVEIRKAISADVGKFSWTVTPRLVPKTRRQR
jgi:hypothetical protein